MFENKCLSTANASSTFCRAHCPSNNRSDLDEGCLPVCNQKEELEHGSMDCLPREKKPELEWNVAVRVTSVSA